VIVEINQEPVKEPADIAKKIEALKERRQEIGAAPCRQTGKAKALVAIGPAVKACRNGQIQIGLARACPEKVARLFRF